MKFASVWLELRYFIFCVVFLKQFKDGFGDLKTVPKALFDKLKTQTKYLVFLICFVISKQNLIFPH